MDRRDFLKRTSSAASGVAVAGMFHKLVTRSALGAGRSSGYGPLTPVRDATTGLELLQLPAGFRYQSFGWSKDPTSTGVKTPGSHDGMAVIQADAKSITVCRNHEVGGQGVPFAPEAITYDPKAGGGCMNLRFDRRAGGFATSIPALSGTVKNCAGGPTPWGTWLTCEESVLGPGDELDGVVLELEREHGYIFEVPVGQAATAEPLKEMGRFVHEAVAVDPKTDIVYETEDRNAAGFYRFLPNRSRQLVKGGTLQMLKVVGREQLQKGLSQGDKFDTAWVTIEDPTRAHSPGTKDEHGVFMQGKAQGATTFARLEGCWYGGGKVFIVSTSGGEISMGQVFEYDPNEETIKLIFESPSAEVLENPDNITVCPKSGGLLLCEDGKLKPQRLHGLTTDGQLFPFAANNIVLAGERNGFEGDFRDGEWAGATFTPDGEWLFVNIQSPGLTFAINGPWESGPLG
ncbi:MAG: DUF839 domain-containing protein [Planctomycetes bacterium]|nr:DUF839 domain-containing protein [Planctomycetota bacterium]